MNRQAIWMRRTAKTCSSSSRTCVNRRARPLLLPRMIPLLRRTQIALFVSSMDSLPSLRRQVGESHNEGFDVLQLYIALVVAWRPAYHPGIVLCCCGCDGD